MRVISKIRLALPFVLWGLVVCAGTVEMLRYSNSPGNAGNAPANWPADSQIPLDKKLPTLVMFVHPRCPCSRASIGELNALLSDCAGRLNAHVVFLKPAETISNWEKTDLWRAAASIPGVTVHTDFSGVEARRFHAETSGQTLLYDQNGFLQFEGGITAARGHSGDNLGRTAVQQWVQNGKLPASGTPVFGCSLFENQCEEGTVK